MGLLGGRFARQSFPNSVIDNGLQVCSMLRVLSDATSGLAESMQTCHDIVSMRANPDEDADGAQVKNDDQDYSGLLDQLTEGKSACIRVAGLIDELTQRTRQDMGEDYKNLDDRENGVQTVYAFHREKLIQGLMSSQQIADLASAWSDACADLPESDSAWIGQLQQMMDDLRGLPENLGSMATVELMEIRNRSQIRWASRS